LFRVVIDHGLTTGVSLFLADLWFNGLDEGAAI
jgi:hypothetical protein